MERSCTLTGPRSRPTPDFGVCLFLRELQRLQHAVQLLDVTCAALRVPELEVLRADACERDAREALEARRLHLTRPDLIIEL